MKRERGIARCGSPAACAPKMTRAAVANPKAVPTKIHAKTLPVPGKRESGTAMNAPPCAITGCYLRLNRMRLRFFAGSMAKKLCSIVWNETKSGALYIIVPASPGIMMTLIVRKTS